MSAEKREITSYERDLVKARIERMLPHLKVCIGGTGEFDKFELIREIENKTDVGELMVKIQLKYLESFKKELFM